MTAFITEREGEYTTDTGNLKPNELQKNKICKVAHI